MKKILAVLAVAGLAGAASADYNTGLQAGPFDSNGSAGAAVNGVYSFTYADSTAMFNRVRIRGTATSGNNGSFLSELRWQLVLDAGATRDSAGLIGGGTWTVPTPVDNTQTAADFTLVSGNTYSFRFWESFNDGGDAGVDAFWNDVQFDLSLFDPRPPCTEIPGFFSGTGDINTFGSNFDTEIGLYDNSGVLLASNDDVGGLQSQIVNAGLADGTYYLALSGFNTTFGASAWNVTPGAAAGDVLMSINGTTVASGPHAAGTVDWYCFQVPAPGAMALLCLGGLAAARRRRA